MGNRQQSRFLALVGNKDLLKQSLATAEDSEGTGTVQALKTMESLETKIQQVQTAYQQFYTTLGVESIWKTVLDGMADYINQLNGMPKLFGKIPIAAINTIMPMVNIIKNLLTSLLMEVVQKWQDIAKAPTEAAQQASGQSEQAGKNLVQKFADGISSMSGAVKNETQKILNEANKLTPEQVRANTVERSANTLKVSALYAGKPTEMMALTGVYNNLSSVGLTQGLDITNMSTDELRQKLQEIINEYNNLNGTSQQTGQAAAQAGMQAATGWERFRAKLQSLPAALKSVWKETSTLRQGISMIGMALQGVAANMDQTTASGANLAATMQLLSSVAMAASYGNIYLAAISVGIAAVNWASSVIKNLSLDSQIERAEKRAEELNNQATLLKHDFKTLNSGIEKYETLKEKRYESAEATEEYQEQVDELAESYPELIKGFDATGDAIIDASAAEIRLAELRKRSAEATAEAVAEEARLQELELKKKEKELNELEKQISSSIGPISSFSANLRGSLETILYAEDMKKSAEFFKDLEEIPFTSSFAERIANTTEPTYDDESGILKDGEQTLVDIQKLKHLISEVQLGEENGGISFLQFLEKLPSVIPDETLLNSITDDFLAFDITGEYKKAYQEWLAQRELTQLSQREEAAQEANRILREQNAYKDNSALATLYNYSVGKEYEKAKAENPDIEDFNDFKSDSEVANEFKNLGEWYNNLSDTKKELFEEMFGNLETYSADAIIQKLGLGDTNVDTLIEEYLADTVQNNQNRIVGAIAQAAEDTVNGWSGEIKESSYFEGKDILSLGNMGDTLKQFYRNFVLDDSLTENETDAAVSALEQYTSLVERGFTKRAERYLTQWQTLYNYITNNVKDAAQRDVLLSQLKDYDLTSVAGIVAAKKEIEDNDELTSADKTAINNALDELIHSVVTNTSLEIKAIQDTLLEAMDTLEENIGDISKEMDYKEAAELYDKLMSVQENPEEFSFDSVFRQSTEDPTQYYVDNYELVRQYENKQIEDIQAQNDALRELISEEAVEDIKVTDNFKYTSGITEDQLREMVKNGTENDLSLTEDMLATIDALGLINSFIEHLTDESYDWLLWSDEVEAAVAKQNVYLDNLDKGIADYKAAQPILDLINAGKFGEAKTLDSEGKYESNITRASEEAYAELLEDYLSSTSEEFAKNAYKYTNDVASGFEDLSGDVNEKLLREYAEKAGYNLQQANDAIAEWYDKKASQSLTKPAMIAAFKDVIADPGAITNEAMSALATSLGTTIEVLKTWFYHNDDDTYSTSLETISSMAEAFGVEATTAIQDALLEYFAAIKETIDNSFEGKMTYAEFDVLNDFFGRSLNLEYTKTADGLELTKQSLVEIYNEVKKIDSLQAESILNSIDDFWANTEADYKNVSSIMGRIQEINDALANPKVSDVRRKELEKELTIAKDILEIRSSDPDSFSFMDNDIPEGMQAPENYWNAAGEAYTAMNEATSSGYMEIQDYYNIINQMADMVVASNGTLEWMGMNSSNAYERAAELIEAGMGALTNIDGDGVKIALANIGDGIEIGAEDMKTGFDDGLKIMAKSQIEMLDAAIRMLEAMVALEDLDINGDGIFSADELFNNDGSLKDGASSWLNDTLGAAKNITIGGKSLSEALEELYTIDPEKAVAFFNELRKIDWFADIATINSQVEQLLQTFFPDKNISLGDSIFDILKIPTGAGEDSETFKEWLDDVGLSVEEYQKLKEILTDDTVPDDLSNSMYGSLKKMLGIGEGNDEAFDNFFDTLRNQGMRVSEILSLWNDITITDEGKFIYNGTTYDNINQVIQARNLKLEKGVSVSKTEGGTFEGEIKYSGITYKIELSEGGTTYTATWDGQTYNGNSEDEVLDKIWQENQFDLRNQYTSKEDFKSTVSGTVEPEIEVKPILKKGDLGSEDGITEEVIEEYGLDTTQINNIAAAIAAADWSPVGEAVGEGIRKAFSPTEGETGLDAGELTIAPTVITIDTTNATTTVGEIEVANITVTIPEGLSNEAITLIENYNNAVADAAANGIVTTGVEANTVPAATLLSILALRKALIDLQNNNEVSASIDIATVGENTLSLIENVLSIYGISGQTAELLFNATDTEGNIQTIADNVNNINDKSITITIEATEAQNAIEELTKDDTKKITITYDDPIVVGPQSTGTLGYSVTGIDNASGNRTEVGHYDTLKQTTDAIEASVGTGVFQNGTFEITEITADGVQTTISATLAEIQAGSISFTNNNDNNNNGNNNGKTGSSVAPTGDFSGLTSSLSGLESAANTAAESVANASSALSDLDSSSITTAAGRITALASAADNISSTGTARVKALSSAIRNIPTKKDISISYKITVSTSGGGATGAITSVAGNVSSWGKNSASGSLSFAKGTRTLMGELGPELVVSNGHYFTVGENGAEFVDLADDAIVFNHLQTKKLLSSGSSGRGTPVTNEKKATSFATGNAMASATAALAELKQIRAMWQALLDASAKDLGSKAGSGSGGSGGEGNNDNSGYEYDLEYWYNLLRQIAKLEQQITYEQAKRENMRSGFKYVDSLEKEFDLLEKQLKTEKELASLQYDYYLKRMEDVNNSKYSQIFTYDEEGLMQYVDGKDHGLDALAKLQATNEYGVLEMSAKEQLDYITNTLGIPLSELKYKSDGSEAKEDKDKVEVFFDNVDSLMDELDGLYDSYHEHAEKIEDLTSSQNEILQEYIDNQISLEGKLLQAIEDREQAEIDRLTDEKEALEKATQDYIDGLSDALNKEKELYSNNQTDEETAKLQRRLAILQRSGGSTSEIKSLQDQIDSRLQDAYFQAQQDQIGAIQEAADRQLEKLQTQIDLMTEALEYQKENGLLWNEVYEMMNNWTPEKMLQFIEEYTKSYKENSAAQNQQDSEETLKEAEIWAAKRDKDTRDKAWNDYYTNADYDEDVKKTNSKEAQEAFNTAFATGGATAGAEAANKIFDAATPKEEPTTGTDTNEPEVSTTSQSATVQGGQMNVRDKASSKGKKLGIVKSGKGFKAVGYSNGWLKVEDASTTKGTKSGYMKYKGYEKYYKGLSISSLPAFAQGGLVDFTGPAWVDGSKSKPEAFLSASDTELLKSSIFSNGNDSLKVLVAAIEEITKHSSTYSPNENAGIVIENATVNIQPGTISNDYDARRAGEMALEEMVKIARKTTNKVVSRR